MQLFEYNIIEVQAKYGEIRVAWLFFATGRFTALFAGFLAVVMMFSLFVLDFISTENVIFLKK